MTIQTWDCGGRPQDWRYIPKLAELFKIDIAEAVRIFWGETIGDPCPCGCGGKKVIPQPVTSKRARRIDYNKAKHLYIALPCEGKGCGAVRIYDQEQGHAALCRRCEYKSRRSDPPPLTCTGYDPFDLRVSARVFANGCTPKADKRRKGLKDYKFVNEAKGEYKCHPCAGAYNLLLKLEEDVREFLAEDAFKSSPELRRRFREETEKALGEGKGFNPYDPFPRIRNIAQLLSLTKACNRLEEELRRRGIFGVTFYPNLNLKKAHEKIKELRKPGPDQLKPKKRENSISQGKGILVQHWKREVLPQVYKGLCHLANCGQIILDSRPGPVDYHIPCGEIAGHHIVSVSTTYRRIKRGILPAPAESTGAKKPGGQRKMETGQKYWAWTMRNLLDGELQQNIAEECGGVTDRAVAKGTNFYHGPSARRP